MRRVLSEKRQNQNALYNYDSLGQKTCFQARLVFFFFLWEGDDRTKKTH